MARASSKPASKAKAKAGGTGAKKPAAWTNLKVAWPQPKQAISLRIDQAYSTGSAMAAPVIRPA